MTYEARVQAVIDFGFTERQARFLVTVMLHSGLCVPRQYGASPAPRTATRSPSSSTSSSSSATRARAAAFTTARSSIT